MGRIYLLLLFLAIATNVFLLIKLLMKKEKSFTSASFIVFLCLILVWAIPQFSINFFRLTNEIFTYFDRIEAFGYIFIPVVFLVFSISFAERYHLLKKFLILAPVIIPGLVFLFLSWTTNLINYHDYHMAIKANWGVVSQPGHLFLLFLSWFEILMVVSLVILFGVYFGDDVSKRRKSLWLIFATLIPLSVGTVTDGILPGFGKNVIPLAIPLTTVMAIIITYAILRIDLFKFSPQNIISSIGDGLIGVDTNGVIIFVNKSAYEILGFTKRELLGKKFFEKIKLLDEKGREIPTEKRPLSLAVSNKFKGSFTNYYLVDKKNRKFPVGYTVSPMVRDKKNMGAIVNFRDISKEKKLEKNKDEFIAIASHELKNPITALKINAQLLEKQLVREGDLKYSSTINRINSQTDRLLNLVGDLLNVSRIQTGKFVYRKKILATNKLVEYALRNVKPTIKGRRILKKNIASSLIFGDLEKLSQVIVNLVVNAHKYTPIDREIIVESKKIGQSIQICVKDFGVGVPKSKQTKIFKKYFQTEDRNSTQGVGIGLYVSKEIIRDHDGRIWVESTPGKGSKFIFTIPIYKPS